MHMHTCTFACRRLYVQVYARLAVAKASTSQLPARTCCEPIPARAVRLDWWGKNKKTSTITK